MSSNHKDLSLSFDTVAAAYARLRPAYVEALYQTIFQYLPLSEKSRVLEIGIGGGQATWPVLQTGCQLTAIEPGENFGALCRKRFEAYPAFSLITGRFEEVNLQERSYDLIYSASAFHWIPEKTGYEKVFSLLKSGGAFARFANHPYEDKGRPELSEAIQALYAIYMPSSSRPMEWNATTAQAKAGIAAQYGFKDIQYALYHRTRTFTDQEYIALLGTYSDHLAIETEKRQAFFSDIARVIRRYGGKITLYDTIDLQLARKP